MLTPDGRQLVASLLLSSAREGAAEVVVEDGQGQTARRPLDEGFPTASEDGESVVFQATFGPEEGNFDWRRESLVVNGETIDAEEKDAGRKALGATWTVQIAIDVK